MKNKFCLMLLVILFFSASFSTESLAYSSEEDLVCKASANMSIVFKADIKITHMKNTVKRGDGGTITIQGRPGARYTIRSSYRIGSRTISVTQLRTGDSNGQAIFNWVVSTDTVPGTYPITITGDGKSIKLYHTVLP